MPKGQLAAGVKAQGRGAGTDRKGKRGPNEGPARDCRILINIISLVNLNQLTYLNQLN